MRISCVLSLIRLLLISFLNDFQIFAEFTKFLSIHQVKTIYFSGLLDYLGFELQ